VIRSNFGYNILPCLIYFRFSPTFAVKCGDEVEEVCSSLRALVPLSRAFNSTAFAHYCR